MRMQYIYNSRTALSADKGNGSRLMAAGEVAFDDGAAVIFADRLIFSLFFWGVRDGDVVVEDAGAFKLLRRNARPGIGWR